MSEPAFAVVRRLLLLPLLLGFAAPVSAQSVYLKCSFPLEKGGEYFTWLTINPGQEFGSVRSVDLNGVEQISKATQIINASQYILKTPSSGAYASYGFTYRVNRTNGAFSRVIDMVGFGPSSPQSGSCKKDAPAKTMF